MKRKYLLFRKLSRGSQVYSKMIKNMARFKTEFQGICGGKRWRRRPESFTKLKDYPIQKEDYHFKQSDSCILRI